MEMLSGYSISQFPAFGRQDRISADDRFFTSQIVNPAAAYAEYESKSLEYGRLVEQVFEDLSAAFGFKSMAYELSDAYSGRQHVHQYNSFDISASYGQEGNIVLATFKIDGRTVRLCMPRQWAYKAPDPVVGELKFKMLSSIARPDSIDINSAGFDGWVYPRGQKYAVAASDFQGAKACFGQSLTATALEIPNINNFIKANPAPGATALSVGFRNQGVPAHRHSAKVQTGGGSREITIRATVTKSAGAGGAIHNGSTPGNPPKYYEATLLMRAESLTVNPNSTDIGESEAGLEREQYPSHSYLPVMIYIGKKR